MHDKYSENPHMIDMSARLQVKIEAASDSEIEQNKKEFEHLNNSIESAIQDYNDHMKKQVAELLEKGFAKKIDSAQDMEFFDKTVIDDNAERLKEKSDFHKIYSLYLQDNMMKHRAYQYKMFIVIFITMMLFFAIIICQMAEKSYSPLVLVRIPNYLFGVAGILSPLLLTFIFYSIMKKIPLVSRGSKKRILFVRFVAFCIGFIFFFTNIGSGINFITIAHALGREASESDEEDLSQIISPTENNDISTVISNHQNHEIINLDYTEAFVCSVKNTYNYIEDEQSQNLSYVGDDIIAINSKNGIEYTFDQLINCKILVPYVENEKEILFYGQYSENNNWDGVCLFNIYGYNDDNKNNVLETILEAEYDDGNLLSYKKVFRATTTQDNAIWSIFDGEIIHENNKKYARGETWNYFRVSEFPQDFDLKNANVDNIIFIDDFEEQLRKFSVVEGYYCGNILNGFYNDDTGYAFTVKYAENGIIRTLYMGRFKNGLPDDESGDAWQIVFDGSNDINRYFYYKGPFKQNKRKDKSIPLEYVSLSEINEMIENIEYDFGSGWYDKDNNKKTDKVM